MRAQAFGGSNVFFFIIIIIIIIFYFLKICHTLLPSSAFRPHVHESRAR